MKAVTKLLLHLTCHGPSEENESRVLAKKKNQQDLSKASNMKDWDRLK